MTREQRWAWSNVLHEYRLWAEWYFRESKYVFGTAPENEHERRAKQLWTATVMNNREACNVQRDAVRDMRKRPVEYAKQDAGAMAVQPVSTPRKHGRRSANKMGSSRAVQQVREHQ